MRKVHIESFCDFCWTEDHREEPSIGTATASVAIGEARLGPPKALELCEEHGALLARLAAIYQEAPDMDGAPAMAVKRGPGRPPNPPGHVRPSEEPVDCPVCNRPVYRRSGLIGHIWNSHRHGEKRPPRVSGRCPECGERYPTPVGMNTHRTRMHGVSGLRDALAGVSGWNELKARRWEEGLAVE